jgi:hypothetical protein
MLIRVDASGVGAGYNRIQRSLVTQYLTNTQSGQVGWCTNAHRHISGNATIRPSDRRLSEGEPQGPGIVSELPTIRELFGDSTVMLGVPSLCDRARWVNGVGVTTIGQNRSTHRVS